MGGEKVQCEKVKQVSCIPPGNSEGTHGLGRVWGMERVCRIRIFLH